MVDVSDEINKYKESIKEVFHKFSENLTSKPIPNRLYHYTNGNGLRGILEHGDLWLTDIFNPNDPTELHHGLQLALGAFRNVDPKDFPEIGIIKEILEDMFANQIDDIAHHFVCCFSIAADELGQWRAYADNGAGFSIGFDGPLLEKSFEERTKHLPQMGSMAIPIQYDETELNRLYNNIIVNLKTLVPLFREDRSGAKLLEYYRDMMTPTVIYLILLSLLFKHLCVQKRGRVSIHSNLFRKQSA